MKKQLILGLFTLAIVLVGQSVSAQVVNFTRNLTVGSQGADVARLQALLISRGHQIPSISAGTAVPGYFGAQTKAAVMAYQAANGIPNTGFFGPLTMASMNAQLAGNVGGGTVNCPPGYNCTPVATTPVCPVGYTCVPVGGGTPVPGNNGLRGGAGDITVTERTSGTSDEILEGEDDIEILGFEVDAQGSDIAINSVRVEFVHDGNGSDRFDRYASEVAIIHDGRVVGSANVRDFSESSDVYSRNIPVSNAIVEEGETERFYVAVSALNNVDSNDVGEEWIVGVGQIRFEDATGVVLTDTTGDGVSGGDNGPISATFTFEDLSSAGNVSLRVTEDDTDVNEARVVQVDDSSDTRNVNILSFNLDAEGSDIYIDSISFNITSTGAGVTEIVNDFRLLMGDDEVGRVSIDRDCDGGNDGFGSNTDTDICVLISDLDDDDVMIESDEEESFMLVADINDIDGNFTSGDSIRVSLDADDIDAENENGNRIGESDLRGSADTSDIEFLSSGIMIRRVGDNVTVNNNGDNPSLSSGVFEITFDVTAIDEPAFIELGSATRGTVESNTGANYLIQDAASNYDTTNTGNIPLATLTRVSGGTVQGEFVRINSGSTARFRLAVTFDPNHANLTSEGYRMVLYSVNFAETAVDATNQQVLTPEVNYRTEARAILN